MPKKPLRVMFVCTGNICRSPLAHAVFEHWVAKNGLSADFEIESAGTHGYHIGEDADPRMRATAAKRGVPFSHPARKFRTGDFDHYDLIFVMDEGHRRHLRSMVQRPEQLAKIRMFRDFDPRGSGEVPDPYYGGPEGFEHVYDIVDRTSQEILEAFKANELP